MARVAVTMTSIEMALSRLLQTLHQHIETQVNYDVYINTEV